MTSNRNHPRARPISWLASPSIPSTPTRAGYLFLLYLNLLRLSSERCCTFVIFACIMAIGRSPTSIIFASCGRQFLEGWKLSWHLYKIDSLTASNWVDTFYLIRRPGSAESKGSWACPSWKRSFIWRLFTLVLCTGWLVADNDNT